MIMRTCNENDFNCSISVCAGMKKSGRNYIYCEITFSRTGEYVRRELPASKYDACVKLYDAITRRLVPLNECKSSIEAL